ncbi:MAG: MHS family MFS transporter [Gammaproteobacteria bacterium]|nr:MHS family MFS transporter [Gammaproteobacteria bacterium]
MSQVRRVIASTMVGNGLEWYDYALYGTFTALISKHFFPAGDDAVALIATFGIFAAGFLMRPLGAMFFGYFGDRYGRKNALALSILLMAFPTACIGLLPTYLEIGIWAPILLTVIRLVQGVAVGGEFGGSIVYLVEHATTRNKNRMGSLSMLSMLVGLLFGAMFAAALAQVMPQADFDEWGWRIPFIFGFFIGIIGLYIRIKLDESPVFTEAKAAGDTSEAPVKEALRQNYGEIFLGIGCYLAVTIPFYIQTVFMPSFMVKFLNFSTSDSLLIFALSLLIMMLTAPIAAWLSDKKDREVVLKVLLILYVAFAIPYIYLLELKSFSFVLISQLFFSALLGAYIAPIPTLVVELFPTKTRYTGMALACNLAAAIFGGTAPILVTKMITLSGSNAPISYYIMLAAFISFFCIASIRKRKHQDLLHLV